MRHTNKYRILWELLCILDYIYFCQELWPPCFIFVMTHSVVYFRLIVSKSKNRKWFPENSSFIFGFAVSFYYRSFIIFKPIYLVQVSCQRFKEMVCTASTNNIILFIIEACRIESQIVIWMLTFRWTQFIKQPQ